MLKKLLLLSLLLLPLLTLAQEDDELLDEVYRDKQIQADGAEKMAQIVESVPVPLNPLEQIQALGHKTLDATAMFDKRVQAILQEAHRESKLRDSSQETLKAVIRGNVKDQPMEKVFDYCPRCLDMAADLLRDEHALPSMIGIFARKDDLKEYGFYAPAIFLGGIILRRYLINPEWNFFRRAGTSVLVSLLSTFGILMMFYSTFEREVGPSWRIIKTYLF